MTYLSSLDAALPELVGGKAANLARVKALGLRVPRTLTLNRDALAAAVGQERELGGLLEAYLGAFGQGTSAAQEERYRGLVGALQAAGLPRDVRRELRAGIARLLKSAPFGLAVRSSAVAEDSAVASFAGVFESWLGLMRVEDVETRVVDAWCSLWSPRALRYQVRLGIEPSVDGMAVILQEVVPAASSGVFYTANSESGDPSQLCVRATRGLSIDLLAGSGVGDAYRLDWDNGAVLERTPEHGAVQLVATEAGPERRPVAVDERRQPVLSDAELSQVHAAARRLDEYFGTRLDVEFVLGDAGLTIVQARPLTALPSFFPHELAPEDAARTWQLAPSVLPLRMDVAPGLLTPLYQDMSDAEMWARYQPDDITLAVFCKESRDVNGHRYYLAEAAPIFSDFFDDPSGYESWLEQNEPAYRRRWDNHKGELAAVRDAARAALGEGRQGDGARALVAAFLDVRQHLWDLNAFGWSGPQSLGWMCDGLLAHLVRSAPGFDETFETGLIVGGSMDSHTFLATRELQRLGRAVHEPEVRRAFDTLALDKLVLSLRTQVPASAFLADYEAFCWRFGRTPPSWHARPGFWSFGSEDASLMHTIRCALEGSSRDVVEVQRSSVALRNEQTRAVRSRLAQVSAELAARFDRALAWTRYWGQALNDRHGLTVGLLWERELLWRLARRLLDAGILEQPVDVLAFRCEDLEAYIAGQPGEWLRDLSVTRRRELALHARLAAPATIGAAQEVPDAVPPVAGDHRSPSAGAGRACLTGTGIGQEVATGVARHVPDLGDPALLDALDADDILLMPHEYAFHHADWHSLLTLVRGVVSPGRPSHHLAQVARECGVPVLAHVDGDLGWIKDGTRLHLDPRSGEVRVLLEWRR